MINSCTHWNEWQGLQQIIINLLTEETSLKAIVVFFLLFLPGERKNSFFFHERSGNNILHVCVFFYGYVSQSCRRWFLFFFVFTSFIINHSSNIPLIRAIKTLGDNKFSYMNTFTRKHVFDTTNVNVSFYYAIDLFPCKNIQR